MDVLRACVACVIIAREVGMAVEAEEQRRADVEARQNGMTWADFDRAALQPKNSVCLNAGMVIAGGLLAGLGGFAGGLCASGHCEEGELAALGMVPMGALFLLLCLGKICEANTNRQNAELIRRLDAGEYIPRPAPQE